MLHGNCLAGLLGGILAGAINLSMDQVIGALEVGTLWNKDPGITGPCFSPLVDACILCSGYFLSVEKATAKHWTLRLGIEGAVAL